MGELDFAYLYDVGCIVGLFWKKYSDILLKSKSSNTIV